MNCPAWLPVFALVASPFAGMAQEAAPQQVPEEIKDLFYLREESVQWYVGFGMESDGLWAPSLLGMDSGRKRFMNKVSATVMMKPGEIFFTRPPMENRFKFTGMIEKEVMNRRTNLMELVKVALFEDLQPNKKGLKYESQYGLPENEIANKAYYDRSAVFSFESAGEGEAVEFKVEELTNFALPPNAASKNFFLKEVSKEKVVVEYKGDAGVMRSATIMQAANDKAEPPPYKMIVIPKNADELAVLEQMEKLKLTPKDVKEKSLPEALELLNQAGTAGKKATGVINRVIRGSTDNAPKVTLPETETNFAAALDEACRQAGFRWSIELAEGTKQPLLVLFHKDEKQSGKRGSDD